MSTTHRHLGDRLHHSRADAPSSDASVEALDMKLENEIIPRVRGRPSKAVLQRLGWRHDDDAAVCASCSSRPRAPGPRSRSARGSRRLRPARPRGAGRLRHRSCPRRTCQTWHRRKRRVARPAIPSRGTAARPRRRARELRVLLLLQRSRRKHVAGRGSHNAAPRPGLRPLIGIRPHGGPGEPHSSHTNWQA